MKGLIFNIQRYSLNDGDGIRTIVFFKGCPLKCPWCSNPESQSNKVEMIKNTDKCRNCHLCENDEYECPTGAYKSIGKWYTIDEIMKEIKKDIIFYQASGGGVTLSGGEVLMQSSFAIELLKEIKRLGIHTAIETCGMGDTKALNEIVKYCDEILFDLKIMNPNLCKELINGDIILIKKNLKFFREKAKKVIVRYPLIPNYTDFEGNIEEILSFMKEIDLHEIHILPFHQYGSNKYKYLERDYKLLDVKSPSKKEVEDLQRKIENLGFKTLIGG